MNLSERWIRFTKRWCDRLLRRLRRDPDVSLAEYEAVKRALEDHKEEMRNRT